MNIIDAKSAWGWILSWGAQCKYLHRMAIQSQQTCIAMCGDRLPVTRAGHVEALRVLVAAWNKRYPEETLP